MLFFEQHLINVFVPSEPQTAWLVEDSLASKAIDQYLKDSLPPHPSHIKQSTGFGTVVFILFLSISSHTTPEPYQTQTGLKILLTLPTPLLLIASLPGGRGYIIIMINRW